ncbi:hypothetical protein [Paracoccus sp. DMF]|uniref:hypothetical protein n=1 Tax=Paracoccus sp. DMF TaxID=400837 RepID=UPI0021E39CDF|nr:hypothetical protein [Paracoccus sp. DMF]MCV2446759.1 hypothetical protein [Paracoccus sp. DMF]
MEPAGLLIGGILALALGFAFFGDDDDEAPAQPEPEMDDEGRVTGTDGGDEIAYDYTDHPYPTEIRAGAGDDSVSLAMGVDTYGEAGDDVIRMEDANVNVIDGGDGNDRIVLDRAIRADVRGGDGDDTISMNDRSVEGTSSIDAGAGEDIVQIGKDPSLSSDWNHTIPVELGAGADSLQIDFTAGTMSPGQAGSGTSAEVSDFDPAEDILTINIAEGDETFLGYEVVERDGNSEVVLTYRGIGSDEQPMEYSAVVRLLGVSDLPASSLQVVTGQAA